MTEEVQDDERALLVFDPHHHMAKLICGWVAASPRDLSSLEQVSVRCASSVKLHGWPTRKELTLRTVVRATGRGTQRRYNRLTFGIMGQVLTEDKAKLLLKLLCSRVLEFDNVLVSYLPPNVRRASGVYFRACIGRVLRALASYFRSNSVRVGHLTVDGLGFDDRLSTPNILMPFTGVNTDLKVLSLNPATSVDPGPRAHLPPDEQDFLDWDTLQEVHLLQDFPPDYNAKMAVLLRMCTIIMPPVYLSTAPVVRLTIGYVDHALAIVLVTTLLKAPEQLAAMQLDVMDDRSAYMQQLLAGMLQREINLVLKLRPDAAHADPPGNIMMFLDLLWSVFIVPGADKTVLQVDPKVLRFKYNAVELTVSEL